MTKQSHRKYIVLLLVLFLTLPAITFAQNKISVLDFKNENASIENITDISNTLRDQLKDYDVLTKKETDEILNKSAYKKNCYTTDCITEIGNILNVNRVFTGSLTKFGNLYIVEAKVVDVKDKKITVIKSKKCDNINEVKEFIKSLVDDYKRENLVRKDIDSSKPGDTNQAPASLAEVKRYYAKESEDVDTTLNLGIGGFYGYNYLFSGYDKYSNNSMFGGEIVFRFLNNTNIESLSYRLYFDYSPMIVPEGNYNLQEDIYNINIGAVYGFIPGMILNPFLGAGLGLYLDWIGFDTPASGSISHTYAYFGFNLCGGVEIPVTRNLSLVPEARAHFILEAGRPVYLAKNFNYLLTLLIYF